MKKLLVVALMFLAVGMGKSALADEGGLCFHGFYIEPNVQAYIPFDDNLDSTVYAGGKAGYQWNEWLALEVELGWANPSITDSSDDVTLVPLLINARINLWPGVYCVDPYVFGGVGVSFNDTSNAGTTIDSSFAGQIGGGAEYHINEWVSIYGDLRFFFSEPDSTGLNDVSLNAFLIGGGAVIRF